MEHRTGRLLAMPLMAAATPATVSGPPEVERVMAAVWNLVRSGPNFDGRQRDVEAAIAAAIDRAVAAERERCAALLEKEARYWEDHFKNHAEEGSDRVMSSARFDSLQEMADLIRGAYDALTLSQSMRAAGFARRPSAKSLPSDE